MKRVRRVGSSSIAAILAVVVVAATSGAAVGAPFNLSEPGEFASEPQVAIDADGDAVFTWLSLAGTTDRVQARARTAAGQLSAIKTLSPAGQNGFDPQVAVDVDGDSVFTWNRNDGTNYRIQGRARSAGGVLGAVENLSAAGRSAFDPDVDVDSDGNALFTWYRDDAADNDRIQTRARSAGGELSAVQTLSIAGQNAQQPQVAVDEDGDAVFTWRRFDGTNNRIQARARTAAGNLSGVQSLTPAGEGASSPQVAVDADGDALFTWLGFDGTHARVQARARTAAGNLSDVQTLSPAGQSATAPQVAVDADGDGVFTWYRSDGTHNRIQARARSFAGDLSDVQTLSIAGQGAFRPQVAVDAAGRAVFTWQHFDGTDSRVQARSRTAAGNLSGVKTLSEAGRSASFPQVAVNADGDAVFTWSRTRVQGAAGRL